MTGHPRLRLAFAVAVLAAGVSLPTGAHAAAPRQPINPTSWNPCDDVLKPASVPATILDEQALTSFGPLAAKPSLSITLPQVTMIGKPPVNPVVNAVRVRGGILLALRAQEADYPGLALTVINDDGVVRWTHCSNRQLWAVNAGPNAAAAVLVTGAPGGDANVATQNVELISVANGTVASDITRDIVEIAGTTRHVVSTPGGMFFGLAWGSTVAVDTKLARIDLNTLQIDERGVPAPAVGQPADFVELSPTRTGFLVAKISNTPAKIAAVLNQGTWTEDQATIERIAGPIVDTFSADGGLAGYRADGTVAWSRQDLKGIGTEGFNSAVTGNVAVANVCVNSSPEACQGALVGVDAATGKTLWSLSGPRGVVEVAGGLVLTTVADGSGYEMLDATTGKPVDPQRWAWGTFANECCGAGDFTYTVRLGGVLVAVDQLQVNVYYPKAVAPPTVQVTPF